MRPYAARLLAPLIVLSALAFAAPASAGTLVRSGTEYQYDGGPAANVLTVSRSCVKFCPDLVPPKMVFTDTTGNLLLAQSAIDHGCTVNGASNGAADSTIATCPDDAVTIDVDGAPGNDTITISNTGSGGSIDLATQLAGDTGTDTITGGAGNDELWAETETTGFPSPAESVAQTLTGGSGNDVIYGALGADTIDGESGNDTIEGFAGSDPLLAGGSGNDIINGGSGNDTIDGGTNNDTIDAGAGNDDVTPGLGDDGAIQGGTEVDTISYNDGRANRVTVDLSTSAADTDGGVDDNATQTARESAVNFENIEGTGFDDTLIGSTLANNILGLGGNDDIRGGDGDDANLDGGAGNDTITGGLGTDGLVGGIDNDTLDGGAQNDGMNGGTGTDTADYATGRVDSVTVTVDAGTNNDGGSVDGITNGSPTKDNTTQVERVLGTPATDTLTAGATAGSILVGNAGDDTLTAGSGGATLQGGTDDDTLTGAAGPDTLDGGAGSDGMDGNGGNDTVSYAGRTEALDVSLNAGSLDDGSTTDGLTVGARDTTTDVENVIGGDGDDKLAGDGLANVLGGGPGADVLIGGLGTDTLNGGEGLDTASYQDRAADAPVNVTLDATDNDGAPSENDKLATDIENLTGGAGDDQLTGNGNANVLTGGDGADKLDGGAGVDAFFGNAGADTMQAKDGVAEAVDCGDGTDGGAADAEDTLTSCEGINPPVVVVDADADGFPAGTDCNDANAGIRPNATDVPENGVDENCDGVDAVDFDRDRDGQNRPSDCNDADAKIKPGAVEILGNEVDENCDGIKAPFPKLDAGVGNQFAFSATSTVIKVLEVRRTPAGAKIKVTCKSKKKKNKGCPFKSKTLTSKGKTVNLVSIFKKRKLPVGTVVEVTITTPDTIGKVVRYTIRKSKAPKVQTLCLPPGGKVGAC